VNVLGGYNARGRTQEEASRIVDDAQAIDRAGAFSLVIEGVVEPIAVEITRSVDCPTIGIGGSVDCEGQVLVIDDMLGMFDRVPRFVKRYDELAGRISAAGRGLCRRRPPPAVPDGGPGLRPQGLTLSFFARAR
jgi:3-methyl-2-oxobutanoate hydroxymethyltransferase